MATKKPSKKELERFRTWFDTIPTVEEVTKKFGKARYHMTDGVRINLSDYDPVDVSGVPQPPKKGTQ